MRVDRLTHILLGVIGFALLAIAIRPYIAPASVEAQAASGDPVFIEPGVYTLHTPNGGQVSGKVVTNLRTGNVYGFPTPNADPYPVSPIDATPQTSHAIPLGRYALNEINR